MFDMRAYTISLVAVFLALGIGILLGTIIEDKGVLQRQQAALVDRIESDIDELRSERASLRRQASQARVFEELVLPLAVNGKLRGRSITVVSTPALSVELRNQVLETLNMAGAEVRLVGITPQGLELPEGDAQLTALFSDTASGEPLSTRVLKGLAEAIALPSANPGLAALAEAGVVAVEGQATRPTGRLIVAVSPDGDEAVADGVLLPLAKEFARFSPSVVGVEGSQGKGTLMSRFKEMGVGTVDNVDQAAGQFSLVHLAAGGSGNFGTKGAADKLLPGG